MTGTPSVEVEPAGNDRQATPPLAVDRRKLLVGTALATFIAVGAAPTPVRAASRGRQAPAAPLRGGARFDLAAPSSMFLDQKRIRDATVMQCFAFDDRNSVLYVAQVMQGGRQLTGEWAPVSATDRAAFGDVCISRVGYDGVLLSSMYLRGFGQPVAIGVEPVGSASYLWLGTASDLILLDNKGFPTRVGRVQFVPGGVVDYPSTQVEVHDPVPDATQVSVSFDALNRTLLVRYVAVAGGPFQYDLYALDAFRARNYRPLYRRTETGISHRYQGHAHYFDQVYRLEGRSGGVTAAPTYVSSFDLPTGRTVQRTRNDAAPTLTFREPEGIAVQRTTPPRLHTGFADGPAGARNISLYSTDHYGV
jgi:hypothetical protein